MKIIIFLAFSFFMQSCVANEECKNPETQYSMNICAGKKLSKLESELKIKVNIISKHLEKIEGNKIFHKSSMAWMKFRNLHCESISQIYKTGSIHSLVEAECKILLTKTRIKNLGEEYKDTINTISRDASSANK